MKFLRKTSLSEKNFCAPIKTAAVYGVSQAAAGLITGALAFLAVSSGPAAYGAQNMEDPAISREALNLMRSQSPGAALRVVQKRLRPKKWLSEISLGVSPALNGLTYINNYSADFGYRLYLNNYWSVHAKYLHFYNKRSAEGEELVANYAKIPVEMKYPQKWAAMAGLDWSPFYGKTILFSQVLRFDIYVSLSGGIMEQLRREEKTPLYSLGAGFALWLHKRFSARAELSGSYYKNRYIQSDGLQMEKNVYITRISFAGGILF